MSVTLFNPRNNLRDSIFSFEMEKLRPGEFGQLPPAHTAPYCTDLWRSIKTKQVKQTGTVKPAPGDRTLLITIGNGARVPAQSCPALSNPMGWSPPISSVHGIFLVRILKWVAIPPSRGVSQT